MALIILLPLFPVKVFATKACPLPPCYTKAPEYNFDKQRCRLNADWIATGKIKVISHDYQGMPLAKDFLTFIFTANNWEKGKLLRKDKILFTVGWCKNQIFPKNATNGDVRIYGITVKKSGQPDEYQFIYIEKISA